MPTKADDAEALELPARGAEPEVPQESCDLVTGQNGGGRTFDRCKADAQRFMRALCGDEPEGYMCLFTLPNEQATWYPAREHAKLATWATVLPGRGSIRPYRRFRSASQPSLDLLDGLARAALDATNELLRFALGDVQVVMSELAPGGLGSALDLVPRSRELQAGCVCHSVLLYAAPCTAHSHLPDPVGRQP